MLFLLSLPIGETSEPFVLHARSAQCCILCLSDRRPLGSDATLRVGREQLIQRLPFCGQREQPRTDRPPARQGQADDMPTTARVLDRCSISGSRDKGYHSDAYRMTR